MKIPKNTAKRFSIYYRCLKRISAKGIKLISSKDLADLTEIKSTQIRKDFSYFGSFGKKGIGYDIDFLSNQIEGILGLKKEWNVVVIGIGLMGRALTMNNLYWGEKFKIKGLFDNDSDKIGNKINGMKIKSVEKLEEFIKNNNIEIAILTVPASQAQNIASILEKGGIKGILNFAPLKLNIDSKIKVEDFQISSFLNILTYRVSKDL
jgi:redox-sensing transcriptional repressor